MAIFFLVYLFKQEVAHDHAEGTGIDTTSMAMGEISYTLYANMILIGYLVKEKGIVKADGFRRALAKHSKAEDDLKAL